MDTVQERAFQAAIGLLRAADPESVEAGDHERFRILVDGEWTIITVTPE